LRDGLHGRRIQVAERFNPLYLIGGAEILSQLGGLPQQQRFGEPTFHAAFCQFPEQWGVERRTAWLGM